MGSNAPTVVAVFNASDDIVEMLRLALENAGYLVVTGHVTDMIRGSLDVQRFVAQHDPRAIVYDIAPPYERNWQFLEHLRHMPDIAHRPFVLTSTHAARVRELVGVRDEMIHEILGKPYDIEEIVDAVKVAAGRPLIRTATERRRQAAGRDAKPRLA
jgi:response regulator RpfG family c-di-GMP phosphodiesterase